MEEPLVRIHISHGIHIVLSTSASLCTVDDGAESNGVYGRGGGGGGTAFFLRGRRIRCGGKGGDGEKLCEHKSQDLDGVPKKGVGSVMHRYDLPVLDSPDQHGKLPYPVITR